MFSGKVVDQTSSPVANVTLHVLNTNLDVLTNEEGEFVIATFLDGSLSVEVSATGFATIETTFNPGQNQHIIIRLSVVERQLDEVIVTAQKREERLQSTALSVSSINRSTVQVHNIWDLSDLTAMVPNLFSNNPGDGNNVTSIRGITSTSYNQAVTTYVDGVNQFSLDTYIGNILDVERIEVLRGPQGTLYGRNAMGGVINVITRAPSNRREGFGEVSIGNHGLQRYSFANRLPIIRNKLFLGTTLMYESSGGFYTNIYNDSKFDKQHSLMGNYYLKWLPSLKWAVTLNVKHRENRNMGTFPLVMSKEAAFEQPFKLVQDAITQLRRNTFNASLVLKHTGTAFNFSSQTSWQSDHRYYTRPIDGDFSPLDAITIMNNYGNKWNRVEVLTQEFKLTSPASRGNQMNWTMGAYMFYRYDPNKQTTRFGKDAGMMGAQETNFSIMNTSKEKDFGTALYGEAVFPFLKNWELTAGMRYDIEDKRVEVLGQYQKDPDPRPVFDTRPDTSATATFSALSPKASLAYSFAENNKIYTSYTRGFRTGGFTELSSDPSEIPLHRFDPEFSNNFEIGSKNVFFNNRLRLNVSLFYSTLRNVQVASLIMPDAVTITRNTGKLTSKGAEVELAATPVKGLQANYNFGFTHAAYSVLKLAQQGVEVDMSGNRQIFTPEVTSMLALEYGHELSRKHRIKGFLSGEWIFLGRQYFDLANTITQNPYSLINAKAGVGIKNIEVEFWTRNLTDKLYIAYAYDFGAIHLGEPCTYGVSARVRF